MGKQVFNRTKRALSILLVTFFIVSLTATVITANCWSEKGSLNQGNFNGNCNGNENLDSFNENNNGNNNLGFGNGSNNGNLNVGNQIYGYGDQKCGCGDQSFRYGFSIYGYGCPTSRCRVATCGRGDQNC